MAVRTAGSLARASLCFSTLARKHSRSTARAAIAALRLGSVLTPFVVAGVIKRRRDRNVERVMVASSEKSKPNLELQSDRDDAGCFRGCPLKLRVAIRNI
jgi:hypothetical protein